MSNTAVPADDPHDVGAAFDQLLDLLRHVANGEPPSREWAVSYIHYRTQLLASPQRDLLPGFLYQCGTIDRFREFIVLYDPDIDMRREFLTRMIGRARALAENRAPPPAPSPAPAPAKAPAPTKAAPSWDF